MQSARFTSVVMKTSAVMISSGGNSQVYRSVSDVPAGLRKALEESTTGCNSATIVIADRRGKEEIAKALQRIGKADDELESDGGSSGPLTGGWRAMGLSRANWLGVAIGFASGAVLWFVCIHHW